MAFTPSLTYKGRPLVRCGNDIYYGSMHDPYVVYLQVLTTKKEGNADVADKVHIVLLSTDESKPLPARIVRQANKAGGLFNALTFGDIMLRNQLKNEYILRSPWHNPNRAMRISYPNKVCPACPAQCVRQPA